MKELIYMLVVGIVIGMVLMGAIASSHIDTMKVQMGGLAVLIERANTDGY